MVTTTLDLFEVAQVTDALLPLLSRRTAFLSVIGLQKAVMILVELFNARTLLIWRLILLNDYGVVVVASLKHLAADTVVTLNLILLCNDIASNLLGRWRHLLLFLAWTILR